MAELLIDAVIYYKTRNDYKIFWESYKTKIKKMLILFLKYAICKKRKRGVPMEYMKVSQADKSGEFHPVECAFCVLRTE